MTTFHQENNNSHAHKLPNRAKCPISITFRIRIRIAHFQISNFESCNSYWRIRHSHFAVNFTSRIYFVFLSSALPNLLLVFPNCHGFPPIGFVCLRRPRAVNLPITSASAYRLINCIRIRLCNLWYVAYTRWYCADTVRKYMSHMLCPLCVSCFSQLTANPQSPTETAIT